MADSIAKKSGRVASLEFLRFIAAVVIILAHFEQITGVEKPVFELAFVWVEFFFMITGFYMMAGALKDSSPMGPLESVRYSFKKAKAIYLVYIFALMLTFFVNIFISSPVKSAGEALARLFHFKWEFVYLQMLGFNQSPQFNTDYLLGPGWYLSAMFIALVPAYFLARRFRRTFCDIIAPLGACSIYYYILQTHGTLDVGNELLPFAMLGIIRAAAGLFFGAFVYALYEQVVKKERSQSFYKRGAGVEYLCYILILLLPVFSVIYTHEPDSIVYLGIFAVVIIFGNLSCSAFDAFLNRYVKKACIWLGNLSLYLYLFHWSLLLAFPDFFSKAGGIAGYAVFFCAAMALAIAMELIIDVGIRGRATGIATKEAADGAGKTEMMTDGAPESLTDKEN